MDTIDIYHGGTLRQTHVRRTQNIGSGSGMESRAHRGDRGERARCGARVERQIRILAVASTPIARTWAAAVWFRFLRLFGVRRGNRFRRVSDRVDGRPSSGGVGDGRAAWNLCRSDRAEWATETDVAADAGQFAHAGLCENFDRYERDRHDAEWQTFRLGLGLVAVSIVFFRMLVAMADQPAEVIPRGRKRLPESMHVEPGVADTPGETSYLATTKHHQYVAGGGY